MTAPAPRENPQLLGHEAAEALLLSSVLSGRLPHAWLIGGPSGIGKATLAYRFARFVFAHGRQQLEAAEESAGLFGDPEPPPPPISLAVPTEDPIFRQTAGGAYPDLLTVERPYDEKRKRMKAVIPVEDVRRIAGFLHRTAAGGGHRVVVVDGAEQMNEAGHNAILKILEEPPAQALLLLVAETPGSLLPTIRSRCRKLTLGPLDANTVGRLLDQYRPDLSQTDAAALARLAEGSIGRALALADAGGLDLYRTLIRLMNQLPSLDWTQVHALGDQMAGREAEAQFDTLAELLVWWLERLAKAVACGIAPDPVVPEEASLLARFAGRGDQPRVLERCLAVWENVSRLFERTGRISLDRKVTILSVFHDVEAALG